MLTGLNVVSKEKFMAENSIVTKDGITAISIDGGKIMMNLDFQRFFAMTDDRDPKQKEGSNEALKKQKKLLKFLSEWLDSYEDIDDLFDDAIEAIPLSERLKDNQKEWFRVTKREKPEDKLAVRLSKLEYHIHHEDAIIASDKERAIVIEYYPKTDVEFSDADDDGKLAKLHDKILDGSWRSVSVIKKNELALEIGSSDTRFMNLFGLKVNRTTMKKAMKYIKDEVDIQTDDSLIVAIQIDGDTTLYIGRVSE